VALCVPNLTGGGAERSAVQVANGLARRGYAADLVLLQKAGPYLGEVAREVRVVDLGVKRARYSILPLARYIRREKPDVVVSNLLDLPVVLAVRLSGQKAKVLLCQHSLFSAKRKSVNSAASKLACALAGFAFRAADLVVAVSGACAEDLLALSLTSRDKTRVVYNPVVSEREKALQREAPSHEWLSDKQAPVILSVGRLSREKDYDTLIRAFALLSDERTRLVILGEGEDRAALEALIENLGVVERVSMPGFADNPYACMARADLFVLSSRYEGLPSVLIQALACGVTCVATDAPGGSSEVLGGGAYGYLALVGDPRALANAMEGALANHMDPDLLRERAELFSEKTSIEGYERLIDEVCGNG